MLLPGDALRLRETPVEFFDGNLLDARGDRPLVAERIDDGRHSITVNNVGWFLEGSCSSSNGAPVNKIDIGNVYVERAASWQTRFQRPHHRNDRIADADCHVGRLAVWRVAPVQ